MHIARLLVIPLALFALIGSLLAQPVAPTSPLPVPSIRLGNGAFAAATPSLSVDLSTRAWSRQFYRAVYFASEGVPIQWTGNYSTGDAGTTSDAFKASVALRINWYRAMAGLPAGIVFDPVNSAKAQKAALMMSVNNALSHNPPNTWTFYSAEGAEAAGNSNLTLGYYGPASVTALILDSGSNNTAVGHRRWLLYPQTKTMGTGDVPGDATYAASQAVWVFDNMYGTTRPAVRDTFVAWPPKGYVPYTQVFPRWSFSYPNADFSSATVSVTRNGSPVATTTELITNGYGENTLVWFVDNVTSGTLARPVADVPYVVTLGNVRINSSPQTFSYTVTVYDPDVVGGAETPSTVSGPASIGNGQGSTYGVSGPAFASSLQWRALTLATQSAVYGAEGGLQGLVADVSGSYTPRTTTTPRTGAAAYHLAHPVSALQTLTLPELFFVPTTGSPTIAFQSRLGWATANQYARVQVSTDDGVSWADVYAQQGSDSSGELGYNARSVSLLSFAGRTIRIRFAYTHTSGTYYFNTTDPVGWLIDDIAFSGVQSATVISGPTDVTDGSFDFTPVSLGGYLLQARGLLSAVYPMEWGAGLPVTSVTPSRLVNVSVRAVSQGSGNPLILGFVVNGGDRTILVRGIGPTLKPYGVTNAVDDPVLNLFETLNNAPHLLATNDNWASSNQAALQAAFTTTQAFSLDAASKDSALLTAVNGPRTAQCFDSAKSGVVLIEAYDTLTSEPGRLVNVSALNYAGTGEDVLIIGFVIKGTAPLRLLIRGVGPELGPMGVPNVISNPRLELFSDQTVIDSNDNWDAVSASKLQAAFTATQAFNLTAGSGSAALIVTLQPGSYTAQLKGVGGVTGTGILEVYVMP